MPDNSPHHAVQGPPDAARGTSSGPVRIRQAAPSDHEAIGRLTLASYLEGGHLGEDDGYAQTLTDVAARAALAEALVGEVQTERGAAVAGSV